MNRSIPRARLEPVVPEWASTAATVGTTDAFIEGARLVVDFAIDTIGVRTQERQTAAAEQVNTVQDTVLRRSVVRRGHYFGQTPWSNLDTDWRQAKAVWGPKVH